MTAIQGKRRRRQNEKLRHEVLGQQLSYSFAPCKIAKKKCYSFISIFIVLIQFFCYFQCLRKELLDLRKSFCCKSGKLLRINNRRKNFKGKECQHKYLLRNLFQLLFSIEEKIDINWLLFSKTTFEIFFINFLNCFPRQPSHFITINYDKLHTTIANYVEKSFNKITLWLI